MSPSPFFTRRLLIAFLLLCCITLTPVAAQTSESDSVDSSPPSDQRPPNVVIIFMDDLGYADIGPFGATDYPTPNLDQMAKEGRKFTDFVTSTAVCSASRAALLTGCYHRRLNISGALGPRAKIGINADEMTLAELCKQRDYATAIYGKWHLGDEVKFLPLQHGFDHYYGLPYSNDMWPYHPRFVNLPADDPQRKNNYPPLPLIEDNKVIDAEVTPEDQKQLTTAYTQRAVQFINDNADRPFFLYVPHSMVHVPLYVSDKFAGKSGAGLFGDVMMEVDWSVGEIIGALKENNIDQNTLVVFTSDNGPWLSYGDHAGSAAPLREGKGTMYEGGYRVPTLMRWPEKIPAGTTCDELASTIDLFPTIAELIDAPLPHHKIDGLDISDLMFGKPDAKSPHTHFACYYAGGQLQAVRDRQYKLVFPHRYRTMNGKPGGTKGMPNAYDHKMAEFALYDLKADVGETKDVAAEHPDVVSRLEKYAAEIRDDLGDKLQKIPAQNARPVGRLP